MPTLIEKRAEVYTRQKSRGPLKQQKRRWSRYSSSRLYLFLSPWILGFIVLTLIPLLYALLVSFTDFDGISGHWHWLGLANYGELLTNSDTWYSLSRTFLYAVITVPLSVGGGLALAVLLNQRLMAVGFFRTVFYLPSVVPAVASAIMWKLIFDRDAGALNGIFEHINIPAITWLVDPTAFYALIILVLWGLGGGMIISLAGLQGIPNELQEAAQVDGAGRWQAFFRVTLPLLTPVLFFQVITAIIASLQTLVQPLLLTESGAITLGLGAPVPRSNYLYMVNVIQQFLNNQRYGYGSAMLWVLFLFILVITLFVFRSGNFWVYYEVDNEN